MSAQKEREKDKGKTSYVGTAARKGIPSGCARRTKAKAKVNSQGRDMPREPTQLMSGNHGNKFNISKTKNQEQ